MSVTLNATFLTSARAPSQFPADSGREVAVAGRSNSGKSSAINALVGRRNLARTGKTPGRTQLINFFGVGEDRRLVDLPGYGYARGPRETARDFETLTTQFFTAMADSAAPPAAGRTGRAWLAGAMLVVDARHPGLPADHAAHDWLVSRGCPVVIVATKGDRLSRAARQRAVSAHETALDRPVIPVPRGADGAALNPLWRALGNMAAGSAVGSWYTS